MPTCPAGLIFSSEISSESRFYSSPLTRLAPVEDLLRGRRRMRSKDLVQVAKAVAVVVTEIAVIPSLIDNVLLLVVFILFLVSPPFILRWNILYYRCPINLFF